MPTMDSASTCIAECTSIAETHPSNRARQEGGEAGHGGATGRKTTCVREDVAPLARLHKEYIQCLSEGVPHSQKQSTAPWPKLHIAERCPDCRPAQVTGATNRG